MRIGNYNVNEIILALIIYWIVVEILVMQLFKWNIHEFLITFIFHTISFGCMILLAYYVNGFVEKIKNNSEEKPK